MAVLAPWSPALIAAANAAEPDPRMTRSNMRFVFYMTELSYKLATRLGWLDSLIAERAIIHRPFMSQQLTLRKTDVTAVSLLFNALSNEYRVGIVNLLRYGPKNVSEISEALKIEQTMASHNLKCLAFCGLVTSQRLGKTIEYTLNRETVEPILRLADRHISKYAVNLRTCKTLAR